MMIRSAVSRKEEKIGKTNIGPACSNSNNATASALSKEASCGNEEWPAHFNAVIAVPRKELTTDLGKILEN